MNKRGRIKFITITLLISLIFISGCTSVLNNKNNIGTETSNLIISNNNLKNWDWANYHYNIVSSTNSNTLTINGVDFYGRVQGTSMQPSLFENNLLLLKNYDGSILTRGQIILYLNSFNDLIGHRVILDDGNFITVQGDNKEKPDPKITRDKIKYIVIGVLYT